MTPQAFTVSEEKNSNILCLLVDKQNMLGSAIVQKAREMKIVLVTAQEESSSGNMLVVPYIHKVPEIPEGSYTHMFFVWDGKEDTFAILEPLLKKAALEKTRFVFLTDYHFYSSKLGGYIQQLYPQTVTIILGDVFGKSTYQSRVDTFFRQAHAEGIVRLGNVGLHMIYPVLFEDTVDQVINIGFGIFRKSLCLAFMQHGMTELSLVHVLEKVNPLIKVDFLKDEQLDVTLPEGEYLFPSNYPVAKKIQEVYEVYTAARKGENYAISAEPSYSPVTVQKEKAKEKRQKRHYLFVFLGLLFLLFSPLLLTATYAGLGAGMLYAAMQTAKQGNFVTAAQFATTGESFFSLAKKASVYSSSELRFFLLPKEGESLAQVMQSGNLISQLIADGLSAGGKFEQTATGTSLTASATFLSGVNSLKDAITTLQELPGNLSYDGTSVGSIQTLLNPFSSLLDILPQLFGFPTQKVYMVLFQNNMELRPGGGFIGSYALVTMEKGKVTHMSIHNVYDADGQLKGHVEPPPVLRRFLQVHWYLRDSNFDVDFAKDAATAAFFLKQETGQSADGVIGVDLTFVKDLLSVVGPVYVPDYNQTVTDKNFFLLIEAHAEKNSFPGSTQKQDFLRAAFTALQGKLAKTHALSLSKVLPLLQAIQNKHMVFGFADPSLQEVFSVNGFSSSLWDGRKPADNTILDFTGMNEANLGVNKANYFIKRQESQVMAISPSGSISGKLTISYTNSSKPQEWPGGAYKNFLRVILPEGAALQTVSFNGQQQTLVPAITDPKIYEAKDFAAPQGLEVYSSIEEGKQLFGFFVSVPEQQTMHVTISYILSQKFDLSKPTFTYQGLLFKQPGTTAYPYSFSLTYPDGFALLATPEGIHTSGNTISFQKDFQTDTPFTLTFTKK